MRALQVEARPTIEEGTELVARCALFADLDDAGRRAVVEVLEWGCVPGGDTLVRRKENPMGAYLVLHGKVRVTHGGPADEAHVEEFGVDALFGALALVKGGHRFEATALQDTEVALLRRERYAEVAERYPVLWRRLADEVGLGARALVRGATVREGVRHFAVLPAHEGAPVEEFIAGFARALRRDGQVRAIDRALFDVSLGAGAADESIDVWNHQDRRILKGIADLSLGYDFVLYRADATWGAWTQRCVRQCEAVLLVAGARSKEPIAEAALDLLREVGRRRVEGGAASTGSAAARAKGAQRLVLVHPRKTREPTGTHVWLERLPGVERVHHVREDRDDHYERLARHMTGKAVGLVLGGGGARGQAHLGVLKALRECGVHIDAVGGTSAGGGIAALSTYDQPFYRIKQHVRTAFVDMAPFGAFSLPFHSLMRKPAVEAPAKFLSGKRWIEDLWLPFFCVSCDIRRREVHIHDRGRLWKALCATTALPGVLPPVVMRGKVLVDGGVVDNVPVEPMRALVDGPLIVVDVSARRNDLLDKRVIELPVNAAVILSHLHPFVDPVAVPNLLTVVMSTMDLADTFRDRRRADLTIHPDIQGYGLTEFEAQNELVAIGYNETLVALKELSPENLARLGTRPERLRTTAMLVDPKPGIQRLRDARIRRAFFGAGAVLLAGLVLAGVLQSPTAATFAVVAALLVPLWVILLQRRIQPAPKLAPKSAARPVEP